MEDIIEHSNEEKNTYKQILSNLFIRILSDLFKLIIHKKNHEVAIVIQTESDVEIIQTESDEKVKEDYYYLFDSPQNYSDYQYDNLFKIRFLQIIAVLKKEKDSISYNDILIYLNLIGYGSLVIKLIIQELEKLQSNDIINMDEGYEKIEITEKGKQLLFHDIFSKNYLTNSLDRFFHKYYNSEYKVKNVMEKYLTIFFEYIEDCVEDEIFYVKDKEKYNNLLISYENLKIDYERKKGIKPDDNTRLHIEKLNYIIYARSQ